MITLQVNPERKEFIIYKTLTFNLVDYLQGAFQCGFAEAQSGIIVMVEDRPETASLFVSWIYRRTAPAGNTKTHLHKLFNLYLFADKICLVAHQDTVVDRIQDMSLWAKILDNRPVFRESLASTQPYTRSVYGTEEYDDPETATLYLIETDIHAAWEYVKSDVHFFRVFLDLVMGKQEEESDPRIRNEDDQWDRYFYHCHLKDNPCRNDDDQDKELEFIPNPMKRSH
ncbi:hypothetical protein DL95DRAFT_461184 [Leptodontidium sp. 2 PMI_412]|nr:hypothetical protein DL95DRAFT_461184 [Leptodontidium sp. 2 PMI_412]